MFLRVRNGLFTGTVLRVVLVGDNFATGFRDGKGDVENEKRHGAGNEAKPEFERAKNGNHGNRLI